MENLTNDTPMLVPRFPAVPSMNGHFGVAGSGTM
ncbi:unnamed protein product, partial [marine sediment metagenome]